MAVSRGVIPGAGIRKKRRFPALVYCDNTNFPLACGGCFLRVRGGNRSMVSNVFESVNPNNSMYQNEIIHIFVKNPGPIVDLICFFKQTGGLAGDKNRISVSTFAGAFPL